MNSYLVQSKAKGVTKIEDLAADMKSGVKLNQFVEIVAGSKLRYDVTPRMKIQAIQNLSTALQYIQGELAVRLVGIGAEDIYGGNLKLILGLLWSMFRVLRLGALANELGEAGKTGSEAQQLIAWVQKQVQPAPYELKVADWSDFRDGKAFGALLNIYDDSFLPWDSVGNDGLANLERAFKGFEEHLSIPQLISPKEVFDGTADERSLTLYTSLIYHAHSTAAERLRLKREAQEKEVDLEAQRRAADAARARSEQMGSELDSLRAENQRLLDELEAARRAREAEQAAREELERQLQAERDRLAREQAARAAEELARAELGRELEAEKNNVETLSALADAVIEEKKAATFKLGLLSALNGDNYDAVASMVGVTPEQLHGGEFDTHVDPRDEQALRDIKGAQVTDWEHPSVRKPAAEIRREQDTRRAQLQQEVNALKSDVRREVKRRKALADQLATLEAQLKDFEEKSLLQGRAFSALDVLKRNLLEHIEDLEQWRDLYDVDLDPSKLSVYDENKIKADINNKRFEEQVGYLNNALQEENRNLTRILRVKDSKRDIEETVSMQNTLFMKTEKKGNWSAHYFKLFNEDLAYYADANSQERLGSVSLKEPDTTVTLLKPEQNSDGEKLFPIKLKLTSGQQFYVATLTKKDRKDWAAILNGRIVHFSYLAITDAESVRPDVRVINLCHAPADCPSVYFDNAGMAPSGIKAVAEILPFLENINVVSFGKCELTDDDVNLLGPGLAKGSIRVLNLQGNSLTSEGAKSLATTLSTNKTIEEVDVSGNQITDEGATALSALFSGKHPIKRLNIEANKVGDQGCAELCKGLQGSTGTTVLHFGKNDIGDAGVAAIAELLRSSPGITEVQLHNNNIGDAGVATLCEALLDNGSVIKVDLSHNSVGPAGVKSIHNLLQQNKTIRHVDVSGNQDIIEGQALAASLQNGALVVSSLAFTRAK